MNFRQALLQAHDGNQPLAAATLVVDPGWQFGDKMPGPKRGADKHYTTMTLEQIMAYELPPLRDDCRLYMWRVSAMQQEALDVINAWRFTLKSELVWRKMTATGKQHYGMGWQTRMAHEVCLIATRGKPKRLAHVRSIFDAVVGKHSEKPDEFYRIVDAMSPGPTVELFARRQWPGWTCLGDEMPNL